MIKQRVLKLEGWTRAHWEHGEGHKAELVILITGQGALKPDTLMLSHSHVGGTALTNIHAPSNTAAAFVNKDDERCTGTLVDPES